MERKFDFCEGEFYHLYNRGTEKREIFLETADYVYFQKLLYLCNSTNRIILRNLARGISVYDIKRENTWVDIGAYCLMPNHFHLLVFEKQEKGISTFMSKLCTAYAVYFNKKYKRTGGLFEGTFKATMAEEDGYLEYLFSYLHLNPIKLIQSNWKISGIGNLVKAQEYLRNYYFSSYNDYCGKLRNEGAILKMDSFPEYFDTATSFKTLTDEWLTYGSIFNVDGTLIDENHTR